MLFKIQTEISSQRVLKLLAIAILLDLIKNQISRH